MSPVKSESKLMCPMIFLTYENDKICKKYIDKDNLFENIWLIKYLSKSFTCNASKKKRIATWK